MQISYATARRLRLLAEFKADILASDPKTLSAAYHLVEELLRARKAAERSSVEDDLTADTEQPKRGRPKKDKREVAKGMLVRAIDQCVHAGFANDDIARMVATQLRL